jgi:hypothetical protein
MTNSQARKIKKGHAVTCNVLVSWEIWKERNVHVFRNNAFTSSMLVTKIKDEAALWILAGAKACSVVMPRE